ncbi:MAG: hypothetical protein SFZ02_06465, partial [bacterium]|nr:hypothetical protein [bacterium]
DVYNKLGSYSMNEREVEKILDNYANGLEKSASTIESMIGAISEMEGLLEAVANSDELKKAFGVKSGARDIESNAKELLNLVSQLQKELSDTARKASNVRY